MAPKANTSKSKGTIKRSTTAASSGRSSRSAKPKRSNTAKPAPVQHKPKPSNAGDKKKKKPPHLRYTEKQLNVPQLNGIRPAGVQKRQNAKKGKTFVDDKESMNAILALVMAEKEGNIESKMIRARQMEQVREARRLEAEKRAQSKKQGLEERKDEIKQSKKKRRHTESEVVHEEDSHLAKRKPSKKRVSFG